MEINNATATSVGALVNSPQPQPAPVNEKPPEKQAEQKQESVVVKLSAQAQQMDRAEKQNVDTERAETRPQEVAEPPGITFMEGKDRGGNVNTFA
jgi:hypothetical protein